MSKAWGRLVTLSHEMEDIGHVIRLANWDQEVMMPPKAGPGRARALATLQGIAHSRLTSPEIGDLLHELEEQEELGPEQSASVRVLRLAYDKATKVPVRLVEELAELEATAYQVWTEARPADDFSMLEPHLSRMVSLKKEQADAIGWTDERYDALLDDFEPGMKTKEVEKLFAELQGSLRGLIEEVVDAAGDQPAFLERSFDTDRQQAFCGWLVAQLGFDPDAGRLDVSPHPFTMGVGAGDVRQTTRPHADALMSAIYAAIHETGHALYEQNLPAEFHGLPVGQVPSLGMHESQSRLWENQVGRGLPFISFMLPELKRRFPEELGDVDIDTFYRGANHASRTLIRVTADETTYNLHVGLRFELELALFRDELDVSDLPGAWRDAMDRWVGVTPDDDTDGVLQDMHWSIGALGYFPTYTLGTLYAAAFFRKACTEVVDLEEALAQGQVEPLLAWLDRNVYSQAYLYPAAELGENILGERLSTEPFLEHLRTKFGALYDLSLGPA